MPSPCAAPPVRLRPWRATDAPAITAMLADPHVRRWSRMPSLGVAEWIDAQRSGERGPSFAICEPSGETALGKIALRLPGHASPATSCAAIRAGDHPVGELSYWVLPQARGRGLAGHAVAAMLDHARATTDLRSVVLDIESDNRASVRVAERLGAQRRSPERTALDRTGVPRTLVVFVVALS